MLSPTVFTPPSGSIPNTVISQNPSSKAAQVVFLKVMKLFVVIFTLNHFQLGIHPQLIQMSEVFKVLT